MDNGAIFSPSLARQQLAAAKDWSYVDGWLAAKFGNQKVPRFERNGDTLKALLALAAYNESADEQEDLLIKVQEKALSGLKDEAEASPYSDLLEELESSLTREGSQALEDLAALSTTLGVNAVEAVEYDLILDHTSLALFVACSGLIWNKIYSLGTHITELTQTVFTLSQQCQHVSTLQASLDNELQQLRKTLADIQRFALPTHCDLVTTQSVKRPLTSDTSSSSVQSLSPTNEEHPTVPKPDYPRLTKYLTKKLREYNDRIKALGLDSAEMKQQPRHPTLPALKEHEIRTSQRMVSVAALEARVAAFHGLPHGKQEALHEVGKAERELEGLRRQRDSLFEGLVEKGGASGGAERARRRG
ncbi:MAG: hypothetical protein M4579_004119 [Chaenotheca gracillima]|nr:MAG: hypothetical protein M4579_004119 [Chaenotheca gracillima]